MMAWLGAHPYLVEGLLLAGGALLWIGALPRGRRGLAVRSGLLLMPFSFTGILFEPEYWNPHRLWAGPIGPEDLLFTFGSGAWAWLFSGSAAHRSCQGNPDPIRIAARYLAGILGGLAVGVVCRLFGGGPMTAAIVAIGGVGLFASCATNRPWRQRVAGPVGFVIAHGTVLKAVFLFSPAFALQWQADNLWGPWIWGLPLDEIAWAAACGAVWPIFMDYVLGIRWVPRADASLRGVRSDAGDAIEP